MNRCMHQNFKELITIATLIMHTSNVLRTVLNSPNIFSHFTLRTAFSLQARKLKDREVIPLSTRERSKSKARI